MSTEMMIILSIGYEKYTFEIGAPMSHHMFEIYDIWSTLYQGIALFLSYARSQTSPYKIE